MISVHKPGAGLVICGAGAGAGALETGVLSGLQ